MRGARGQSVVLSIAMMAASIGLSAQHSKSRPAHKSAPAEAKESDDSGDLNLDTTFSLLTEAYNTSRNLTSEERIPLLSDLCEISASMTSTRTGMRHRGARVRTDEAKKSSTRLTSKQVDKLRDWAEELFQLGNEFPSGSQLRSQAEVAAARSMVSVDPKRAMELLNSFDAGSASNGRDSRWSVVSTLFNRLYDTRGRAAFPDIRREALSLGDRGVYPYFAISNLLNQVKDQPEVARQFFADAIDYFRRGGTNRAQVFGFMTLLTSDQVRNQLRPWQLQDAANQVVAQVKDYVRTQGELQLDGESVDPKAPALLQFVKSTLKRFAPEAAAQLPDPATLSSNEGGYLLSVNANSQRKAPKAPVAGDSTKTLQKEFEKSRTAMMKLGEDEIHEGPEMQQIIDRTISLGVEVVERTVEGYAPEDHGYAMIMTTPELSGVARLGAHINPAATLSAIRQIQDDELKTKLLLSVAHTIEYLR